MNVKVIITDKSGKKADIYNNKTELINNNVIKLKTYEIKILLTKKKQYQELSIFVTSNKKQNFFLSVSFFSKGNIYSYKGKVASNIILTQDHISGQTFPSGFFIKDNEVTTIVSQPPFMLNNYTYQEFEPNKKQITFHNGTVNKKEKKFQKIKKNQKKEFSFLILNEKFENFNKTKYNLLKLISNKWSDNFFVNKYEAINSLIFSQNYMLVRKNNRKESKYLIIPGINYSDKQYLRDAFHQSTILPFDLEQEIYNAVYLERITYAENPFLFLIWSYRIYLNGGQIKENLIKKTLKFILKHTKNGWYIPRQYQKKDNLGWKSWFDTFYFNKNDSPGYTQSLYIPALNSLKKLNIKFPEGLMEKVIKNYINLFNGNFIKFSKETNFLSVDVTFGNFINYIYFGKTVMPKEYILKHYENLQKAKTNYGYKNISNPDGSYLDLKDYGKNNPFPEEYGKGNYQYGGSWLLYEIIMLLNNLIYQIDINNEVVKRFLIEIKNNFSLHECLNTIDGSPEKPEQGWNASIFYFLYKLYKDYNNKQAEDTLNKIENIFLNYVK